MIIHYPYFIDLQGQKHFLEAFSLHYVRDSIDALRKALFFCKGLSKEQLDTRDQVILIASDGTVAIGVKDKVGDVPHFINRIIGKISWEIVRVGNPENLRSFTYSKDWMEHPNGTPPQLLTSRLPEGYKADLVLGESDMLDRGPEVRIITEYYSNHMLDKATE